jgi:hypothetical protein
MGRVWFADLVSSCAGGALFEMSQTSKQRLHLWGSSPKGQNIDPQVMRRETFLAWQRKFSGTSPVELSIV